jgi:hypothetical protein
MKTRNTTRSDQAAMVEKRYGKTLGASKGNTVKPKVKVTPSGTNPLKKKIGVKVKATW